MMPATLHVVIPLGWPLEAAVEMAARGLPFVFPDGLPEGWAVADVPVLEVAPGRCVFGPSTALSRCAA